MWHFDDSAASSSRGLHTAVHNALRAASKFCLKATRDLEDGFEMLRPDVLHAIRHTPIFLPCSPTRLRGTISLHSFYPPLRRRITATITPHALKWHPNTKVADFNIDPPTPQSSFLGNVLQFQIRLSHRFLPVKGGKRRGKKSDENDDFSLPEPVACNLLWHSTSSASLFNNFVHRGHKKKKAGRLVRVWWQVPIQTLNINGGESEA